MVVPRRPPRFVCCALLLVGSIGCDREQWRVGEKVRASDLEVAAALGDTSQQNVDELAATEVPAIAYPQALRPCCAFGADLEVAVGQVRMPGVEIANLLDIAEVGAHRYDNGYLSLQRADPRGIVDDENNGLIYTCRGGFIDLAHVRDNADNTLAITSAIARSLETGGSIDAPPQGAAIRVQLRAVKPDAIRKYGRMQLATALAQWIAYQLSIWHEIATFYGYASLANWPEKISAFSPEDLYSNQIGVRLAAGVILGKGARSDIEYALSMDAWIQRALERLRAVPRKDALAGMREVDGAWWDSAKRIPDWTLVTRRQFETEPHLRPWRIEDASPGTRGEPRPLASCRDAGPALVLHVVDGFAGARFRDYASLELDVDDSLVTAGLALPNPESRRVTQGDFPAIIEAIREEAIEALGAGADAP